MPSLPSYVVTHAADAQQSVPYLVEILTGTPCRWTTFGNPLYALTYTWTNAAIRVSGLSLNAYDATECSIVLGDQSDALSALDLSTGKGIAGTVVNIYECWLDPTTFAVQATVKKFRGRIERVSIKGDGMTLTIGGYVALGRKQVPRWIASAACPYVFKDARCGYGGADATCLHSWADCGARTGGSNQARFGGFRNLPKPGTTIKWTKGTWTIVAPDPQPPQRHSRPAPLPHRGHQ